MSTYLVAFQVSDVEREVAITDVIEGYGCWARATNNVWFIKSDSTNSSEIRHHIANKVGIRGEERLIVVNMSEPAWASYNIPKPVTDWLEG